MLISKILDISNLKSKPDIRYIAISIASIDVREIFYQLSIANTVDDENDLFSKFEIEIQYLIDSLIKPLKLHDGTKLDVDDNSILNRIKICCLYH